MGRYLPAAHKIIIELRLTAFRLSEGALVAGRRLLERAAVGQHESEQGERVDIARFNLGCAAQLSFGLLVSVLYQECARFREATQSGGLPPVSTRR